MSITLSNLQRLAHFAEDKYAAYNEKARSILSSNGQFMKQAPHALASMVSGALMAEKGYMQVRPTTTTMCVDGARRKIRADTPSVHIHGELA